MSGFWRELLPWLVDGHILSVSLYGVSSVWDKRTLVSFLLRTPVQSGQGSTLRISFHLSEVTQSCLILCDPMDYSLPGSFVHWIFQARVLEWVAISFSRGSS